MKRPETRTPPIYLPLLALVLLAVSSCAGPGATARDRYNDKLRTWTREAKVFKGVEERLGVVATYRAPAFREAYSEYYARSFDLTGREKDRLQKADREAAKTYTEFFLSVHTSLESMNNLDDENSSWKIYIEDSRGNRAGPVYIKRLLRKDPVRGEFFPYIDLWSTAYVVRFPRRVDEGAAPIPAEDSTYLKLVMSSVLGHVEMKWPLAGAKR